MITRRSLLTQVGLLGLGAAGYLALRDRLPGAAPQVSWAQDAAGTGWLPLADRERRLAIVEGRANGAPVAALVDSGAQISVLDQRLADRLDLLQGAAAPVVAVGLSGGARLGSSAAVDLELGGLTARRVRAAVLDLRAVAAASGRRFDLIVGRDLLGEVIADFDFPGHRVAFHDPRRFVLPAVARAAATRGAGGALYAEVSVEGGAPLLALVDTGASSALALSSDAAERMGLLSARTVGTAPSVTLGGVSQDRVVRAERLHFGGRRFEDVRVQIYHRPAGAPLPDGLVGTGVLGGFRAILDHGGGVMHLVG